MEDFSLFFIAAQALGFIGYFLYSVSSYAKKNKTIALFEGMGCSVISIQALMMGSLMGCLANLLYIYFAVVVRAYGFDAHGSRYRAGLAIGFLGLLAITAYAWTGSLIQIFAFLATTLFIIGRCFKTLTTFRMFSIVSMGLWVAYNFILGSVPGVLFSLIYMWGHFQNLPAYATLCRAIGLSVEEATQAAE